MNTSVFRITALAAFLLLFAAAIYIYRPTPNNLSRVSVTGEADAKVAPDTAVITFSVVTQGKQAVDVQQENARRSEAVKKAVEATASGSTTEIKTSGYSLSPQQDYYSGKIPKILGYEAKNTVTVSIGDLDRVGSVIDAATGAGANSVDGIQFVISESNPAQGEALSLASKQAMAKAEAIARSLNGRIVRVVQAAESGVPSQFIGDNPNAYTTSNTNAMVDAKPQYATPVRSGSLDVHSQVVLVVDIGQ
jgi:uncharacterized protein YggE